MQKIFVMNRLHHKTFGCKIMKQYMSLSGIELGTYRTPVRRSNQRQKTLCLISAFKCTVQFITNIQVPSQNFQKFAKNSRIDESLKLTHPIIT